MSTPAHRDGNYTARVMVELIRVVGDSKIPRRVHVWLALDGRTLVSFPSDMTEDEAKDVVSRGLAMLKPLDVAALFREPRRRKRHIETEG